MALIDWIFHCVHWQSPVPNIPSKSHGLADENKVFDGMEMIRNNRIGKVQGVYNDNRLKTDLTNNNAYFKTESLVIRSCNSKDRQCYDEKNSDMLLV